MWLSRRRVAGCSDRLSVTSGRRWMFYYARRRYSTCALSVSTGISSSSIHSSTPSNGRLLAWRLWSLLSGSCLPSSAFRRCSAGKQKAHRDSVKSVKTSDIKYVDEFVVFCLMYLHHCHLSPLILSCTLYRPIVILHWMIIMHYQRRSPQFLLSNCEVFCLIHLLGAGLAQTS